MPNPEPEKEVTLIRSAIAMLASLRSNSTWVNPARLSLSFQAVNSSCRSVRALPSLQMMSKISPRRYASASELLVMVVLPPPTLAVTGHMASKESNMVA